MKKFLVLLLAPVVLAGCTSVTNLTPSQAHRNAAGLYTVELKWDTQRRAVRPESIKPEVVIGDHSFPMQAVPLVRDRWETDVPVSMGQHALTYHFKIDYLVNAIPTPKQKTYVSPEYTIKLK